MSQKLNTHDLGAKAAGFLAALALSGAVLLVATDSADAQSRQQICQRLSSDLGALSNSRASGGNSTKYRQYDSAVRKQNNQINRAESALRRNGCVGLLRNARSQCRSINASLDKMQANLASLKRQRASFAPAQAQNSGKRRQILAAMKRYNCGGGDVQQAGTEQPERSRRRTLLEQVFGVRTYDDSGNVRNGGTGADETYSTRFATFRTLCVRKSDGYYFPISFSTVPDRFDTDEETCRNMCPSSDVELYVHRMPQEDAENMVSYRTDVPYAQEPFAFAYRKAHDPNNKCRFSVAGLTQSIDTQANGSEEPREVQIRIGIPNFRKDPTLAPDVQDNMSGGFNAADARDYIVASRTAQDDPNAVSEIGNRRVRIVGPAFFPVQ